MSVVVHPAHRAVLADYAVFHVVEIELTVFYLFDDAFFHFFEIVGMNKTFERAVHVRFEVAKIIATEHPDQCGVGVQYVLVAVGGVDQQPAGDLVKKIADLESGLKPCVVFGLTFRSPDVFRRGQQVDNIFDYVMS